MKNTIAEYGLVLIAAILVSAVFTGIVVLFQNGGGVKDAVVQYITSIC